MSKFFTSLETYFFGLVGMLGAFLLPIVPFLFLAFGLILLDTITGIIAARKRGEKLKSRRAARVVDKTMVYSCSVVACHGVEVVMSVPGTVTYFAVGAIAFTELMSVLENTRIVTGTNIASVIRNLLPGRRGQEPESEDKSEE